MFLCLDCRPYPSLMPVIDHGQVQFLLIEFGGEALINCPRCALPSLTLAAPRRLSRSEISSSMVCECVESTSEVIEHAFELLHSLVDFLSGRLPAERGSCRIVQPCLSHLHSTYGEVYILDL